MEELADIEEYEEEIENSEETITKTRNISYIKGPYNFPEAYEFGLVIK